MASGKEGYLASQKSGGFGTKYGALSPLPLHWMEGLRRNLRVSGSLQPGIRVCRLFRDEKTGRRQGVQVSRNLRRSPKRRAGSWLWAPPRGCRAVRGGQRGGGQGGPGSRLRHRHRGGEARGGPRRPPETRLDAWEFAMMMMMMSFIC